MEKFKKGDTVCAYSNNNEFIRGFVKHTQVLSFISKVFILDFDNNKEFVFYLSLSSDWKILSYRMVLTEKFSNKKSK